MIDFPVSKHIVRSERIGQFSQKDTGTRAMKNTEEVTSGAGNKRPFTIAVEGNIGAGKSTFLEHFSKVTAVEVFPEPVAKWQNMGGQNLLELQYSDPERWSHLVQSYIQVKKTHIPTVSLKKR